MVQHFRAAQDPVYSTVLAELLAGDKRTHWMWFIFPQLAALGRSPTAKQYGLADLDAARAYLADPVLGGRLRDCVATVLATGERTGRSAHDILHAPDDLKLRSCLTLFEAAASGDDRVIFSRGLTHFYGGERDRLTLDLIGGGATPDR